MTELIDLVIRPATASERGLVTDLWVRAGLTTSYNDPASDFDFAIGRSGSDVLVGVWSEKIVASAMVGHDGHRGWLYYVSVDPDVQNRGYGAAIVAACEAWLRIRGVPKVMLLVRETNSKVVGFYGRNGYEAIPRTIMQKWLTPQH